MFTQCAPSLPPRLPLRPVAHPFILHECGRVAGPSFYNQLSDHPEGRILLMHFVLTDFTIPSFLSTFLQHAWNRLWSVCASVLHTFSTCKINSFRLRFSFCASPFASYVAAIAGHLPYIFFCCCCCRTVCSFCFFFIFFSAGSVGPATFNWATIKCSSIVLWLHIWAPNDVCYALRCS